jgi:hypothetical protein
MPHLVAYAKDTGLIQGVWSAALAEHLVANIEPAHPTLGYLEVADETLSAAALQERYCVQDGVLHACEELTLVATPNPFVADAVAECVVCPQPFVPCTLLVGPFGQQTEVVLAAADDPLILTADVPQVFAIQLAPLAGYWAAPITIEAV